MHPKKHQACEHTDDAFAENLGAEEYAGCPGEYRQVSRGDGTSNPNGMQRLPHVAGVIRPVSCRDANGPQNRSNNLCYKDLHQRDLTVGHCGGYPEA